MIADDGLQEKYGDLYEKKIEVFPPVPFFFAKSFVYTFDKKEQERGRERVIGANFSVPLCTPVYATRNGTVLYSKNSSDEDGLMVNIGSIDHELGRIEHSYKHLDRAYVSDGDYVVRGRLIGLSGNSGNFSKDSRGSFHLNFSVYSNIDDKKIFFVPVFVEVK